MAELNLAGFSQVIASQARQPADITRGLNTFLAFRQQKFNEMLGVQQLEVSRRQQENSARQTALQTRAQLYKEIEAQRELTLQEEDLEQTRQFMEKGDPLGDIPIFRSERFKDLGKFLSDRQEVRRNHDFSFQMWKNTMDQVKTLSAYSRALAHRAQLLLESNDIDRVQEGMDLLEENGIFPDTDGNQIGIASALVRRGEAPDFATALTLVRQRSQQGGRYFVQDGKVVFAENVSGGDLAQAMAIGAKSQAQQRVAAARPAILALRQVRALIDLHGDKALGMRGQVQRKILNQLFGQVPGFEGFVDTEVTEAQVALGLFTEKVLRKISDDQRFSIPDRMELKKIIPSADKLLQSQADAQAALGKIEQFLTLSMQSDLSMIGEGPVEEFLIKQFKTPQSIKQGMLEGFLSRAEAVQLLRQFKDEDLINGQ